MTCKEAEAQLVEDADGRLESPRAMRLHAHLEGCAACRQRAALWRGLTPGLRALTPPPPDAMRARRMQIEIERQLAAAAAPAAARFAVADRGRRWAVRSGAAGLVAAAALVILWLRHPVAPPGPGAAATPAFATVLRADGQLLSGGRAVASSAALGAGAELALTGAGQAEVALGRDARLRLAGPTRLTLGGTRRDVTVRLDAGTVAAEVAHRGADETFAIVTRDLRVEVRGTRFSVGAAADRSSWVRVDEGRVEVRFSDGSTRLVSAGQTASSPPAPSAPPSSTLAPPPPPLDGKATASLAPAPFIATCAEIRRLCEATARAVRDSMRAGDRERALRLLAAAERPRHASHSGEACGAGAGACEDELGYLRAEALRSAGRIDAAISAYKMLDRRGAPAAMRQNALYAVAELERRQGQVVRARADYQKALAAEPRGALREEAMVGAMDSAATAGDRAGARQLARRYLREFPEGLGATSARRLVGSGGRRP